MKMEVSKKLAEAREELERHSNRNNQFPKT